MADAGNEPPRPVSAVPVTEEEFQHIFSAFDRDQDGLVSIDELVDLLRACGLNPTKTEACKVMMEFDKNFADGALDYNECKNLFERNWKSNAERQLVEAFRKLDQNKNGFIEKQELKRVLMNYGDDKLTSNEVDELVQMMVSTADLDMNKKIDYYEFARAMASRPDWGTIEKKKQSTGHGK